jgi:CRISPR/Cas system-associated protein Csm6
MKTTLDIADPLLNEARRLAAREKTTLRALVEQGLRQIVAERKRSGAFRLRKASYRGNGLRPELRDAGWERLRDMAYEGRGS